MTFTMNGDTTVYPPESMPDRASCELAALNKNLAARGGHLSYECVSLHGK